MSAAHIDAAILAGMAALAVACLALVIRGRRRGIESPADRAARIDADIADARAAAPVTEYAVEIAPGIYRDTHGGYVYGPGYLLRLAERCRHIDTAAVESLLWIAAQQAQDAEGVPPLVVHLVEDDVIEEPKRIEVQG